MTRRHDNLEQLLALAVDHALTVDERRELDRALAADEGLRAELRRYERLAELLSDFRKLESTTDLSTFSRRVSHRIRGEVTLTRDDSTVDALLRTAAGPMPEVDWDQLSQRISARVHRETKSRTTTPGHRHGKLAWFVRVAFPLAAAAVIALAMWWPQRAEHVAPGGKGAVRPSVFVSYDKSLPDGYVVPTAPIEGSGIAIGPPHQEFNELPIDPAMFP